MGRTRSILIDCTVGRMFTSVDKTTAATASNLIAGSVLQTKKIAPISNTQPVYITYNLSNGLSLGAAGGLVNATSATVYKASAGAGFVVTIKKGTSYGAATTVGTITFAAGIKSAGISSGSFTVAAGESLYADVVYSGNPTVKATGLNIFFYYFPNAS